MLMMIPVVPGRGADLLVERRFRLTLRCYNCGDLSAETVIMAERTDEAVTIEDFYRSELFEALAFDCDRCGWDVATVARASYLPS